jgi:hypothetical protein
MAAAFSILQQKCLMVNAEKCLFSGMFIEFLGDLVTVTGINPLPSQVQAIAGFLQPARVKQLQAFLGLFNSDRRFVPAEARIVLPLTPMLRSRAKGAQPLV